MAEKELLEVWKDIAGYEDYSISNMGNVSSIKSGRRKILSLGDNGIGYLKVRLSNKGVATNYYVHRLVAIAFISNNRNDREVNHKNEIKSDNRACNLEWCSSSFNKLHGNRCQNVTDTKNKNKSFGAERPVVQSTKEGHFIKEYKSIKIAEQETKVCHQNIHKCCKGDIHYSHAGGYKWKFKE